MNRALIQNIFLLLSLLGCAATNKEETIIPPPTEESIKLEEPVLTKHTPSPTKEASAILKEAEQAKIDATGYVAWKKSRPENIERLTTLTLNLNGALQKMQHGKVRNRYSPGDVAAAQAALKNLQNFLQNKGD